MYTLFSSECRKADVVHQRAEAVPDRIGDHPVDLGVGVDLIVVIGLGHLLEAELTGGQHPLVMERGVGERAPNLPARIRVGMPMSPMHRPIVGTLLRRASSSIRRLSCGWLAIVQILMMSGSSPHSRRWISSRLSGVLRKSCRLMIRLVRPNRGIDVATSSSRSTYSTPSAMAVRSSSCRCSSLPANFPPSTVRRQVIDHRAGPVGHQPPQVHVAVDVVQPQFDQPGALVDQVPVLGDHVSVPAAANADADHGEGVGVREF